jgi:hypothetical protein
MASRRHSAPLKTPLTGRCFQRGRVLAIVGGSAFVHETKSMEAKETTRFSGALSGFDRPSPARPRARTVRPYTYHQAPESCAKENDSEVVPWRLLEKWVGSK